MTRSPGLAAAIAARVLLGMICKFRSRRPIAASYSALRRPISPSSAVGAAPCRQSVELDLALFGTMETAMFHSEATGITATSWRPATSRKWSI